MGINVATLAAIGSVLGGIGAVGSAASGLMGGKGGSPSAPQPVQQAQKTGTSQQAMDQSRKQAGLSSANRSGTILTSPLGLTEPASTARPTLLGA